MTGARPGPSPKHGAKSVGRFLRLPQEDWDWYMEEGDGDIGTGIHRRRRRATEGVKALEAERDGLLHSLKEANRDLRQLEKERERVDYLRKAGANLERKLQQLTHRAMRCKDGAVKRRIVAECEKLIDSQARWEWMKREAARLRSLDERRERDRREVARRTETATMNTRAMGALV